MNTETNIYYPSQTPVDYLTTTIPIDLLMIITDYAGLSSINLATTSTDMMKCFEELTNYFLINKRHPNIYPLDTPDLTTTLLLKNPKFFKTWGASKSSIEKEIMLFEAVRRGDINKLRHIMSLGVDVDAKLICGNTEDGQHPYPVQEAMRYNQLESLEFLFMYGADVNPMCNIAKRCFLDGPIDLLDDRSELRTGNNDGNDEIIKCVIDEHIKAKQFDIFINNDWRSDERLFPLFCNAIVKIPRGTLSGYCSNCDKCKGFCSNISFCDGRMLCSGCVIMEPPDITVDMNTLWVEPIIDNEIYPSSGDEYEIESSSDTQVEYWEPNGEYYSNFE